MKNRHYVRGILCGIVLVAHAFCGLRLYGEPSLIIGLGRPGHPVSPLLWGVFFEDINQCCDGGLYPELIRNRSFEESAKPVQWSIGGSTNNIVAVVEERDHPLNLSNRRCLMAQINGLFTLKNNGYWGMNFKSGQTYHLSLAARATNFSGSLNVTLNDSNGVPLASGRIPQIHDDWQYYTLDVAVTNGDPRGSFTLSTTGTGVLWLDMISLIPGKTWKGHGLRSDLASMVDELHPSFLRFPGGGSVEGRDLAHIYHWKDTVGDYSRRKNVETQWKYWTTYGIGILECLRFAEDLHAEPVLAVNVGTTFKDPVPLDQMGGSVQDGLDIIEFARGPTNSMWGSMRSQSGHAEPFPIHYMQVGNDNNGPAYVERWPLMANAIRLRHPEIQLIAGVDMRSHTYPTNPIPDIIAERYYESSDFFTRHADLHDKCDRHSPKVFVGEYTATKDAGNGNLGAAIGEAAFMTGIERNSDVVVMASFSSLFANVNHRTSVPGLICFDSYRVYGTPSYYVQQLFSLNRGDITVPVSLASATGSPALCGLIGVGTSHTRAEYKDIHVLAPDGMPLFQSDFNYGAGGWVFSGGGEWFAVGEALRQNGDEEKAYAFTGNKTWTDFTLMLQARKFGGSDGFIVFFRTDDRDTPNGWYIGSSKSIVRFGNNVVSQRPQSIEIGRWYNIRVEASGSHFKCYLDGTLMHSFTYTPPQKVFASATIATNSGTAFVKIVNSGNTAVNTTIQLNGAPKNGFHGRSITLTSTNVLDENSLDNPFKVSPKTNVFEVDGLVFTNRSAPNSLTVLRLVPR